MSAFTLEHATQRARMLAAEDERRVIGVVGPPGAGKSTLAAHIDSAVAGCVVVPMDGFHLAQQVLEQHGLDDRKGAPETFDAHGYVALLQRVRAAQEAVWAPAFDRVIENAVAGSICVPADAPLVVTEGNYLLLPDHPWSQVRRLLDEVWYVDVAAELRQNRLIERRRAHGESNQRAHDRAYGADEDNARLVERTRPHADRVVRSR